MIVRPAGERDHAAIADLWNPVIRDTTIIFHDELRDAAMVAAIIAGRRAAGHEFLVAEDGGGGLAGFASYSQFRAGSGYAHALEHSIILAEAARGQGIGRALMARLEDHARAGGGHRLFAGVSGENAAGVAFHQRLGFRTLAVIPEAGRKFGRWLDLVLMMKEL